MSHWLIYWTCWGAMFVIAEGIALFNKTTGDTLSETVWAWLKGKRTPAKTLYLLDDGTDIKSVTKPIEWSHNTWRTWMVGSFLLWLFFHLTFGWFAG